MKVSGASRVGRGGRKCRVEVFQIRAGSSIEGQEEVELRRG